MHNSDTIKIKIPMVRVVEDVLKNLRQVIKLHNKRIFQIRGDIHINRVSNFQRYWRRACTASSVDWHIRPKDLRHFFGSHLLNSGVDPLMIASFMGHTSLDMLLKRYGHFTDQTRREAILKFDTGYTNRTQAQNAFSKSLKNNDPRGSRTLVFGVRGRHELTNVYQPIPGTNSKTSKNATTLPAIT